MANGPNVGARFSEVDKTALIEVAKRLERSRSDTLRMLVREMWAVMQESDQQTKQAKKSVHTTAVME